MFDNKIKKAIDRDNTKQDPGPSFVEFGYRSGLHIKIQIHLMNRNLLQYLLTKVILK